MRFKKVMAALMAATMVIGTSMTSFAAGWQQNSTGWWYGTNADNSTWYSNGWQWIDGNGDGVAECYYFDANGYMLSNTTTPDGYQVNGNGAWIENGVVKTQGTGGVAGAAGNHNAGYNPERPLANKIDEWNLRLSLDNQAVSVISLWNVQTMLTGQMDQYFATPIGDYVDARGNHIYTSETAYNNNRKAEQDLYNWYCNWLNGMNFENMSEMDRAKEIQKVLAECRYEIPTDSVYLYDYNVLINKKGVCEEFATAASSLAKALGLKCRVDGAGNHAFYYIEVDGEVYGGQNQYFNLSYTYPNVKMW